ncbi:Hypothetical protein ORPV_726 [Orpheovirus IHUMI-LCC2]|uniref:Uncharacterized protein n=1 Tax=Orpheovirus IHUMI-LCC2 TaxID=2023057 RepID=A0A2I2L548_9VIRU|nr:Hypothetical protein ORPV_726 [Orpheovirus IHUMI-LCC2]SNW62630.1 Hypothetical protein ORPV_726 [Orpheovirus IHUMI-LCC2]
MSYDTLQYKQYCDVLQSGHLSLDALSRIVKHDDTHGDYDAEALARKKVLEDGRNGKIVVAKLKDEPGDALYGNSWPLPLTFVLARDDKHDRSTKIPTGTLECCTHGHH